MAAFLSTNVLFFQTTKDKKNNGDGSGHQTNTQRAVGARQIPGERNGCQTNTRRAMGIRQIPGEPWASDKYPESHGIRQIPGEPWVTAKYPESHGYQTNTQRAMGIRHIPGEPWASDKYPECPWLSGYLSDAHGYSGICLIPMAILVFV